jgi:hypothetical protein
MCYPHGLEASHWLQQALELQQALDSSSLLNLLLLQQQGLSVGSCAEGGDNTNSGLQLAELLTLIQKQQGQVLQDEDEEQGVQDEEEQQHQQQLQLWLQEGAAAAAAAGTGIDRTAETSRVLGPGSNLTAIHLPFRAEHEDVGQKLEQLRPTLLLFLRKLRCLMLTGAVAGEVRCDESGSVSLHALWPRLVACCIVHSMLYYWYSSHAYLSYLMR